jgi:hypothetical protein
MTNHHHESDEINRTPTVDDLFCCLFLGDQEHQKLDDAILASCVRKREQREPNYSTESGSNEGILLTSFTPTELGKNSEALHAEPRSQSKNQARLAAL